MDIEINEVQEIIKNLESGGGLSIKEEKYLKVAKLCFQLSAERDAETLEYDYLNDQIEYWKNKSINITEKRNELGADLTLLGHENVHYADAAEMEIAALRQRIAELESHKAALLKFIRDSCYVFDGADEDISDAYVDAITSGIMPKLESVAACNPPLFWVRVKSDGGYEGPIHDSKLEDVRKKSGEWLPLTLAHGGPEQKSRTVTVKLPTTMYTEFEGDDFCREVAVLDKQLVIDRLTAAGIKLEVE